MTLRIINEDELNPPQEDEAEVALSYLLRLMAAYQEKNKAAPYKVYVSDTEELQSMIMYAASTIGLKFDRTAKPKTYLE
jgi:hypothetical protein